ncbi:MAG: hypothetical protein IPK13_25375 [Deltaproteobacteria bacterium]|nr:hypothetical protein [Deltaproteobacteria bacterium]
MRASSNLVLAPSVTYRFEASDVWLSVSGAFQLTGENRRETMASAASAEHGLALGVDWSFLPAWAPVSTAVALLVFPFADTGVTGATVAWVLEPTAVFGLRPVAAGLPLDVDVDLELTYSIPGHAPEETFLYARPTISHAIALSPSAELTMAGGMGYKLYHRDHTKREQHWDTTVDIDLNLRITNELSLRPGVHAGWSDQAGSAFSDALFAWGTISIDIEL